MKSKKTLLPAYPSTAYKSTEKPHSIKSPDESPTLVHPVWPVPYKPQKNSAFSIDVPNNNLTIKLPMENLHTNLLHPAKQHSIISTQTKPQSPTPKIGKSEEELKEEEELQLAIALSQSEAQAKEEQKKRITSSSTVPCPKGASPSLTSLEPKVHFSHRFVHQKIDQTKRICLCNKK